MKKKLSIADIAEQLKVSKTTISFVLNGKGTEAGISKAMQKKVLDHIQKVGYRPNRMAQGLRSGKSKTIGMLIEDISDAFFSTIARRFEEILASKGYRIIYGSTENDTDITKKLIEVFRNHQVDGYIIAPPPGIEEDIRSLQEDKLPVVIFDRPVNELDVDSVMVDNYRGSYKGVQHLLASGYKNIAMITLTSDQMQMSERERGYKQCMEEAGCKPVIMKIKYHESKEKSVNDIQAFLRKNPKTDAIFFATNYIAESGLEALIDMNITIPDNMGVIAFDDHTVFRLFKPSITAISQPIDAICSEVVNLLFDHFNQKKEINPKSVQLSTNLVIRNSSSRVSAG